MHDGKLDHSEDSGEVKARFSLSEEDREGFQKIKCNGECTGVKVNVDSFHAPKEMVSKMTTAQLVRAIEELVEYRNSGLR
ncbi:MAG: hypothetical protein P8J32_02745 [bacterium]|nr:hypothetical protein [bacterium]